MINNTNECLSVSLSFATPEVGTSRRQLTGLNTFTSFDAPSRDICGWDRFKGNLGACAIVLTAGTTRSCMMLRYGGLG